MVDVKTKLQYRLDMQTTQNVGYEEGNMPSQGFDF